MNKLVLSKYHFLKRLRAMLAILFFVPALLYFVDFAGIVPAPAHALLHLQIVPALLGGAVALLLFQLMLVLLFGRIYCSVICPAGVLQDIINRLFCMGKKKSKGVRRFAWRKPLNILRYVLLGIAVVPALAGVTELVVWLDPYSNFGRIAANLFRPVAMWGNNLFAEGLRQFDNYSLYQVTVRTVTTAGWLSGAVALLLFAVLTVFRGRLFCNTLCPVGALLSLASRYAFFRITFNKETCNSCGICERVCKAEAIDSKNRAVDSSRCVDCFNCLSSCPKGGLQYRFAPFFKKEITSQQPPPVASQTANKATNSRRSFLAAGIKVAAALPAVSAFARHDGAENDKEAGLDYKHLPPVTPPGSGDLERFKDKCIGCHVCVARCPTQVLKPAGLQFGFGYLLRPHCSFKSSYCNYECTVCGEVCPTHAIRSLTKEEKKTTQVGIATFNIHKCIVYTEGTDCGACSEHCPTQAVHMVPYRGTQTIPKVEPELCIGCGGCESICPVKPHRAIVVKAHSVHQTIAPPPAEEAKEVEIKDFGF